MKKDAIFSPDRIYRYTLTRLWDEAKPTLLVIGLNPSTADETIDDPTIRRCIGFAKRWNFGTLLMGNIFAFRATDPKIMKVHAEPIGEDNDIWLIRMNQKADMTILAYGNHGKHLKRHQAIIKLISEPYCFKVTKGGMPSHPLYLPYTDKPLLYEHNVS